MADPKETLELCEEIDRLESASAELLREATRLKCELESGAKVLMRVAGEMIKAAAPRPERVDTGYLPMSECSGEQLPEDDEDRAPRFAARILMGMAQDRGMKEDDE